MQVSGGVKHGMWLNWFDIVAASMGWARLTPITLISWKHHDDLDWSLTLKNCRHSLAKNLHQQAAASDTFNLDKLSASLPASMALTLTDISTDAIQVIIQHHKNRKTSNLQTEILTGFLPDYHHYSANGLLHVFRACTNERWHSQFPECFESYFLDHDNSICSQPLDLKGMHHSPPGVSYPRISEGYLDFGPTMNPCYDNCLLVYKTQLPKYDKIIAILLCFILLCHNVSPAFLLSVFALIMFYSN